jgi:predicted MFS family arabinose efflux permease
MSISADEPAVSGSTPRRHLIAVAGLFFANGATLSNWLPRIPEVRDTIGVSNSGLGLALIGGGLGGLVGSFLVPVAIARLGSKRLVTIAALALALLFPMIAFVPNALALWAVLTCFGLIDVNNDLAMNTQGVLAQDRVNQPVMNRLHGIWSLGFVVGALIALGARALEVSLRVHLLSVGVVMALVVVVAQRALVHDTPTSSESVRPKLSGSVVGIALLAFATAVVEVVPIDWSAVVLTDLFDADRSTGLGSVMFAGAMLVGRLFGDHVLMRVGPRRLLGGAFVCSGIGAALLAIAPGIAFALAGLAVWGLGVSVLFPQLYERAARTPNAPAGAGLAAMSIGQRLGFMLTGPIVGQTSDQIGLRWAIGSIIAAALLIVLALLKRPG